VTLFSCRKLVQMPKPLRVVETKKSTTKTYG